MNWELISDVLLSPTLLNIYAMALGVAVAWLVDNHVDKPWVKELSLEVAKAIEAETPEGTAIDRFLDEFIKRVETQKGRKPTAGELKSAVDFANKSLKIQLKKDF